MRYISLFSGAGISDVGFDNAGWECLAQVEIDKQANDVRKRHFPNVAHYEDVRSFDATEFLGRVDAVVGGFPCQDYSVAGQRGGLAGDRGALWWEFHRIIREARPALVVGENVPGLLSSGGGRDFGAIVESLVELGYRVAWRVLDLRYFGVPQRRRRVFIVASLGNGRCAEILFEPESLQRHPAESREAGQGDTQDVAGSLRSRGGGRDSTTDSGAVVAFIPELKATWWDGSDTAATLTKQNANGSQRMPDKKNLQAVVKLVTINMQGGKGLCHIDHGVSPTIGSDSNVHAVAEPIAFAQNQLGEVREGESVNTLNQNSNASGRNTPMIVEPIGFPTQGINSESECVLPMLRPCNQAGVAEPVAFQQNLGSQGGGIEHGASTTLKASQGPPAIATAEPVAIRQGWRVRRLTPVECERLMGLPDGYTETGASGREIADGPRYRMLGNGWAVPQAEWIARQINDTEESA